MSGFGAPAGSPFAGQSSVAASADAGLPFAGVPSELLDRVAALAATEPDHDDPEVQFDQTDWDRRPFTLRTFLRPHLLGLVVALTLVVVETLALLAGPVLTAIGIDTLIETRNRNDLYLIGATYVGAIAINMVAGRIRISWTGRLSEQLMYELRVRVFTHFQRLSLDFYTEEKAGRLMTRMTSDIESLTALFQEGIVNMAVQALTLIVILGVLLLVNPTLAIVLLAVVLPPLLLVTFWFRGASDRGYRAVRDRIADVLSDLSESLAGIRLITAHNRRRHNVIHHQNVLGAHLEANSYTARVGAVFGASTEVLGILGQAMIILVGGRMVLRGELTLGQLTLFFLYLTYFFAPIQQLVSLYNTYQSGQAAITKLRELLGTEPSVVEAPDARPLPPTSGAISLQHVSFGYQPDRPVLVDLTLEIRAGETLALVGPTGAGKSTIAKLIPRFYDPQGGCVRIDGQDLREITLASLRRQLGVVPQEPFLFHGTFRDNLSFARPGLSHEDLMEAVEAVGLSALVNRTDAGLDSPIHERGATLSSGERQLIALARAFLARPRVLILDEATSSLDLQSEAVIERALDVVLEGRTAVIIAHRLQTAMRADRIAVIDEGSLVELGSHAELLAQGGRYAAMYQEWQHHLSSSDMADHASQFGGDPPTNQRGEPAGDPGGMQAAIEPDQEHPLLNRQNPS